MLSEAKHPGPCVRPEPCAPPAAPLRVTTPGVRARPGLTSRWNTILRVRWRLVALLASLLVTLVGCIPDPPATALPTLPAVLDITPAPTLDIDATATVFAALERPTPTAAALYTVQSGDTLSAIAERYNTTVDELVAANGLTDPNALQPGQTLLIPSLLRTPVVTGTARPLVTPSPTLATP